MASKLFTSEGYNAKVALDQTSAETLASIQSAWQPVAGFQSNFHTPILALDAPFIELIVNSYKAQIASGEANLTFEKVVNGVLAQEGVVYNLETDMITYNDGKSHSKNSVTVIIDYTLAYVNAGLDPQLLTASFALYDGYTVATDADKFVWTLTHSMLTSYLSGDYTNMVGQHYETLRKLPVKNVY